MVSGESVESPFFPGATGVSGLSVYPWPAEDGRCGGSPHLHLACTEAYVVVSGRGAVQTLTAEGLRETPLAAGRVVWFGPGTIHRAINHEDLRIMVVMQNSGLPEAGDAVFTFPPAVVADPDGYARFAGPATSEEFARQRRDLAVSGFLQLAGAVASGEGEALVEFYRAAVALKAGLVDEWEKVWQAGPVAAVRRTGEQLTALREGRIDHLLRAGVRVESAPAVEDRRFGMCGRLDVYDLGGEPR